MMIRRASSLVLAAVLAGTLLVVGGLATPAGADPVDFELEMREGGGILQLRGSDAVALQQPTIVSGTADDDTGVISITTFDTPQISFEQEVTSPLVATAHIDATFREAGIGTGSIDPDGNLVLAQTVAVDLHVEVVPRGSTTPLAIPGDCTASPIMLDLRSDPSVPYVAETGEVTVSDADFSIPAIPVTGACAAEIANAINNQLAGAGHTISLSLVGDIDLPPAAPCATVTTLEVSPSGVSALGDTVLLGADVAPVADDPDCVAAADAGIGLTGTVDFYAGRTVIGSSALDGSGSTSFSTSSLPAGLHALTARYRVLSPFDRSASEPVDHLVTAAPAITTSLPPFIELDGGPVEFDVAVNATGFAAPVEGARLDLTARSSNSLDTDKIMVEVLNGATWVPITLSLPSAGNVIGSVGALDVLPGEVVTTRLRVAYLASAFVGSASLTFELVPGDAAAAPAPALGALARGTSSASLVAGGRQPITLAIGTFLIPAVQPHTIRQGGTLTFGAGRFTPNLGVPSDGSIDVLLDGEPVSIAELDGVFDPGFQPVLPFKGTGGTPQGVLHLPRTIATGTHQLTIRYSGNQYYEATQAHVTFTVLPALGSIYECSAPSLPAVFRADVLAQGNVPSVAPPGEVQVDHLAVKVLTGRSTTSVNAFSGLLANNATTAVGSPTLPNLSFGFGPSGGGTATGVARSLGARIPDNPNPAIVDIDQIIDPQGESGTAVLEGEVGEVVPVTLDRIHFEMFSTSFGFPIPMNCIPVGSPATLGEVRIAGVDLTVAPVGTSRQGDDVQLIAEVGDEVAGGVMEFRAGTTTIGVVPVGGTSTSFTTDDLPVGEHDLNARYYPIPASPVQVSESVAHTVVPALDCEQYAEQGAGAAVRLMYMTLLQRCPDQAGYDYWVGQLEGGATPDAFAVATSGTAEAQNLLINRGYETMLDRQPSTSDRDFWRSWLRRYKQYPKFLAALASSEEFLDLAGGTRMGYVDRLFAQLLDRGASGSETDYWTAQMILGWTRGTVAANVAFSPEAIGELVDRAYRDVLAITPGTAERATAVTTLRSGNLTALYARLVADVRFSARAQGFPNFRV